MRRAERRARRALVALALAPFLIFVPRVLLSRTPEPRPARPAWAKMLVLTVESWPGAPDTSRPALARLEARSARVARAYSASDDPRAAAWGLWTGRWPAGRAAPESGSQALAAGWSLFEAARRSGALTAAFDRGGGDGTVLGFGGFDFGSASPDPAAAAAEFIRRQADRRWLVWVHLREAGPGGARVDGALAALDAALDQSGQHADTLTVVTALARAGPRLEDRCRVPFWVELPSALYAGRRGRGGVSQVDLAGLLVELLRLPPPGPDELPLQSRAALGAALRGGASHAWQLFSGKDGELLLLDGAWRITWSSPEDPHPSVESLTGAAPSPAEIDAARRRGESILAGIRTPADGL